MFLGIWKGCGRASGGFFEGVSWDLEGSGDVEGFGKISGDLGEFGRIWISWDSEGFPCLWKGLEGLLVNAGMGNLPEKGAVISLLKDYWLPCHRVDRM